MHTLLDPRLQSVVKRHRLEDGESMERVQVVHRFNQPASSSAEERGGRPQATYGWERYLGATASLPRPL